MEIVPLFPFQFPFTFWLKIGDSFIFLPVLAKKLKIAPCSFHFLIKHGDNHLLKIKKLEIEAPFSFHFLIDNWRSLHFPFTFVSKMDIAQISFHFLIQIGDSVIIVVPVSFHFLIKGRILPPPFSVHCLIKIRDSSISLSLCSRRSLSSNPCS